MGKKKPQLPQASSVMGTGPALGNPLAPPAPVVHASLQPTPPVAWPELQGKPGSSLQPSGSGPVLATPTTGLRLDLACGQHPREGFEGVDLYDGAQHKMDLLKFPWPWGDSTIDELHCSHFIEHIPMEFVDERHQRHLPLVAHWGKDLLFAFFDECYRVLKPECWLTILCPNASCNRAFQDPTHRRFIVAETFVYMMADWRKANGLDHYKVDCNFAPDVQPIIPSELSPLHPEAAQRRMRENWNTVLDWQAKLRSMKPKA